MAIRAFFPVWVWLYVMQFVLWPLLAWDTWYVKLRLWRFAYAFVDECGAV